MVRSVALAVVTVATATATAAPAPSTCRTAFVIAAPATDNYVTQAAAQPAISMSPWPVERMAGPFATRDDASRGCKDVDVAKAQPPFAAISHCWTGDPTRGVGPDNLAEHQLVVKIAAGWWTMMLGRDTWPHGDVRDERPRIARVRDVQVADRLGDGGVEVTAIVEEGPPGDALDSRVVICGVRADGKPACGDVKFESGRPFHHAGALRYRVELACDGQLSVVGWEGGNPVRLIHGRGALPLR